MPNLCFIVAMIGLFLNFVQRTADQFISGSEVIKHFSCSTETILLINIKMSTNFYKIMKGYDLGYFNIYEYLIAYSD